VERTRALRPRRPFPEVKPELEARADQPSVPPRVRVLSWAKVRFTDNREISRTIKRMFILRIMVLIRISAE
jgi:hypothetical protein